MEKDNRYLGLNQGQQSLNNYDDMLKSANSQAAVLTKGPPVTAMQAAQNALADATQLALRVESVVERLIGAVPQAVGGAGKDAVAGSVFRMLHQTSDFTSDRIRSAHDALNRLEGELP